ncbi:chloroplast stem-loop binding protein of 41 kDa b, chloroplastic [Selaginella moellendorffii]|uniref:chloroplast stem-loop binding protein of 41 kDa b, chloroplastic n=1 Tax=Selaginella moellendorffii TaxID=88036 RepID=UPI000D1C2FE6|nr:chloroplast stem-loop binding protein of 41 kDa b, chloroplastic [Selaginella moellendorffii]|eukprot:XP_002979442.2 chloroplast stem-loop binding protein of 41 kDa b, chloroplastic [Selaginella moellendorffii]
MAASSAIRGYGASAASFDGLMQARKDTARTCQNRSLSYARTDQFLASDFTQNVVRQATDRTRLRTQAVRRVSIVTTASSDTPAKKILMMGGTRFIGVYLARLLVKAGHEVTLFTRGKTPVTQKIASETDQEYAEYSSKVKHIQGDRQDFDGMKSKIASAGFEIVYDINGREAVEVEPIIDAIPSLKQYIYCSSAGVYLKSDLLPHFEVDATDPKSRHKGKLDTEALLQSKGVPWTSIRPVYIYGPLNYNPVEEWFFHRLKAGRPIPIPNSGLQITQLGHVKDLADAFVRVLDNPTAFGQVYNISGAKYVTFAGIARACAKAGGFPTPELVHYNPKDFDFGKKKSFPLRDQHFFTSIEKAKNDLGWSPKYGLVDGLTDSYNLDFGLGTFRKAADFSTDDMILEKLGIKVAVPA